MLRFPRRTLTAVVALAAATAACPVVPAHEVAPGGVLTHGPDPEPPLAERTASDAIRAGLTSATPQKVPCAGNGTSGKRVQVMYVRASNAPDNYAASKAAVAAGAIDADRVFRESAAETSGMRRIRFVHDAYCNLSILNVVLDPSALISGDLGPTSTALKALGYTSTDRKYLLFVDHAANLADDVNCGIGGLYKWDDQPGAANASNGGPGFARVGPNCWNVTNSVAAHELMHNLGAVQNSAPNWNGVGHCLDDTDRMCYDQFVAGFTFNPTACLNHERLFDCNHDDYFHTDPPAGNYLDTHWNTADSQYLSSTPEDHWGFVQADDPTAASAYTPDTDRNQNSTYTPNTVARTGTGVYAVTFPNLASYGAQSGSAAASAVGTAGEHCTVSSWNSNGTPDTTVIVRCFDAAGVPADAVFDASYIRPTASSAPFAYLWAQDEAAASYTPSTHHQFNSTGATNTIVRNSTGDYTVTLPGLATSGGTVKVTAFSAASSYCKASDWDAAGADERVDVLCFDSTGAPADVKFTLSFADDTQHPGQRGVLGLRLGQRRGRAVLHAELGLPVQLDRGDQHDHPDRGRALHGHAPGSRQRAVRHQPRHRARDRPPHDEQALRGGRLPQRVRPAGEPDPALRRRGVPHRGGHAVRQQVRRAVHPLRIREPSLHERVPRAERGGLGGKVAAEPARRARRCPPPSRRSRDGVRRR